MPSVGFKAAGFPDKTLNVSSYDDAVSWNDVFKAAVTVGHRDQAALSQYGVLSWFEALTRFYRIRTTLTDSSSGAIGFTELFRAMDPSEKAGVAYYLGLTFCKLYASRHLKCPWLMHHDVYRTYLASPLTKGMRPDLVGLSTTGEWSVFEAKGCRRRPSQKARDRAKEQAKSLPAVQGQQIKYRIASWTQITRTGVSVFFEDPQSVEPGDQDDGLRLSAEDLLKHYYRPLLALHDLTASGPSARAEDAEPASKASAASDAVSVIRDLGLYLQIEGKLLQLLRDERYREAYQLLRERAASQNMHAFDSDGVTVRVTQI